MGRQNLLFTISLTFGDSGSRALADCRESNKKKSLEPFSGQDAPKRTFIFSSLNDIFYAKIFLAMTFLYDIQIELYVAPIKSRP